MPKGNASLDFLEVQGVIFYIPGTVRKPYQINHIVLGHQHALYI